MEAKELRIEIAKAFATVAAKSIGNDLRETINYVADYHNKYLPAADSFIERFSHAFLAQQEGMVSVPLEPTEEERKKYYELIMAVENKYPNETRHETALRYIKERETSTDQRGKTNDSAEAIK